MQWARSVVLAFSVLAMSSAIAQMQGHTMAQPAAATAATAMSEGEVRKVDKEAGKITLKHGDLKNLQMPPMTMVFQVKDKAMLDKIKAGDKVRFTAENPGGQLTVTAIEPMK